MKSLALLVYGKIKIVMKVKSEERQTLVANIESGQYKKVAPKKSGPGIVVAITCIVTMLIMLFSMIKALDGSTGAALNVTGFLVIFFVFIFLLVFVATVASGSRGADLSKLTSLQRWLIMDGEAIEADLDAIDQNGNLFTLRASADYKGQRLSFASPAIGVRPIPFDERKITVYINPENPSQYLVDFYSHLPLMGDDILRDRSEMKCEPLRRKGTGDAAVVLIICAIMFGSIALSIIFLGLAFIGGGHGILALFWGLGMPVFMCVLIAAFAKRVKDQKNVTERGFYVLATGTRFWVTKSKNSTTYHLASRYIEPSTKRMHEFRTTGPSSMRNLQGAKVRVYINPDNLAEYYVDVQTSLHELGFTTSRTKEA